MGRLGSVLDVTSFFPYRFPCMSPEGVGGNVSGGVCYFATKNVVVWGIERLGSTVVCLLSFGRREGVERLFGVFPAEYPPTQTH